MSQQWKIEIRKEKNQDAEQIHQLLLDTFPQDSEAKLVQALRTNCTTPGTYEGYVAVGRDHKIVGFILYTPVTLESSNSLQGYGLAPMAVALDLQRQGVGAQLIRESLVQVQAKCDFVVVLGHIGYYPKFGFEPAAKHNLRCKWPVPEGAFQVIVNQNTKLPSDKNLLVSYRPEFDSFE